MARIRQRKRAVGGMTYQVCWVLGGGSAGNGAKGAVRVVHEPEAG